MWQQQACYCLHILHEILRIEFVVCSVFCTTDVPLSVLLDCILTGSR